MHLIRKCLLALAALTLLVPAGADAQRLRMRLAGRIAVDAGSGITTNVYDGTNTSGAPRTIGGTTYAPGASYPDETPVSSAYPDLATSSNAVIREGALRLPYPDSASDYIKKTLPTFDFTMSYRYAGRIAWDFIDGNNHVFFQPQIGGDHFLLNNTAGTWERYEAFPRVVTSSDLLGIRRAGSTIYVTLNGVDVWSGTQGTQTHNKVVGLPAFNNIDDWTVTTVDAPIALAGINYNGNVEGYPKLAGSYNGSDPTSIEYRVVDAATSAVLINWSSATGTIGSGAFDLSGSTSLGALTLTSPKIQVRALDGATPRAQIASLVTSVPAIQAVPAMIKGINASNSGGFQYYWNLRAARNPFKQGSWRAGESAISPPGITPAAGDFSAVQAGMGQDGVIHQYPPGRSSIKVYMPTWWDIGTYQMGNLPSGMSIEVADNGIDGGSSNFSWNATTKVLTTTQHRNYFAVSFTGTIPAGGIDPTFYRVNDTHTDRAWGDDLATAYNTLIGSGGVVRTMDDDGVNQNLLTRSGAAGIWYGSTSMGPTPPPVQVGLLNAAGVSAWKTFPIAESDAAITWWANYYALNKTGVTYIELSNEVWNGQFLQWYYANIRGLRAGYYTSTGAGANNAIDGDGIENGTRVVETWLVPNQNIASGTTLWVDRAGVGGRIYTSTRAITANSTADAIWTSGSGWTLVPGTGYNGAPTQDELDAVTNGNTYFAPRDVANQNFAANDYLIINRAGYRLLKATRSITANTAADAVAAGGNATWTEIAGPAEGADAGRRWYGQRSKEMFALWDAAYTSAGRSLNDRVRVIGAFIDNLNGTKTTLAWNNVWANYDMVAPAPYWGSYNGWNILDWNGTNPGWTATQKNLILTDTAAFDTAAFAHFNLAIDQTIDGAVAFKQGLASWLWTEKGVHPNARRFGAYESGWHPVVSNVPGTRAGPDNTDIGAKAAFNAHWNAFTRDARMGMAMTRYLTAWKNRVGDLLTLYTMGGQAPAEAGSAIWAIADNDNDTTNPVAAAVKNFVP